MCYHNQPIIRENPWSILQDQLPAITTFKTWWFFKIGRPPNHLIFTIYSIKPGFPILRNTQLFAEPHLRQASHPNCYNQQPHSTPGRLGQGNQCMWRPSAPREYLQKSSKLYSSTSHSWSIIVNSIHQTGLLDINCCVSTLSHFFIRTSCNLWQLRRMKQVSLSLLCVDCSVWRTQFNNGLL